MSLKFGKMSVASFVDLELDLENDRHAYLKVVDFFKGTPIYVRTGFACIYTEWLSVTFFSCVLNKYFELKQLL